MESDFTDEFLPEYKPGLRGKYTMKNLCVWLIRAYQLILSPWLGGACRFMPSCSEYALEAIRSHGALRGTGISVRRLARCHPLCSGGYDPVPGKTAAPPHWKA